MLNCGQVLRELESYLDDSLAADVRKDLQAHLGGCHHCEVVLDSARHTLRIVAGCKTFELPESLSDRIMASVRAQKTS